ncbi:MAG TPA: sigma-54 dependent transcriptional regulator, partial [Gemmatimonadaceae bacterium]|nr:sigma-54 dependent transcriptional regulator [Gemmatimonadaceae bacterium]
MLRHSHTPPAPGTGERAEPLVLLVVDDDPLQRRLLQATLERPGRVRVEAAGSAEEALARLERGRVDAILTDLAMPGMDGVELVRHARRLDPALPIVVATAHASLERAVEGIRAGATDFLAKPVNADAGLALLDRHAAERPLREEVAERRRHLARVTAAELVAGDHPRLDEVRRFAEQVAATPTARVLITGESGTGKSLLARAIHLLSRAAGRFVEVNCAALPAQLLETELFGHEKGAFTDARALKRGLIESADRGTLLLDEISAMPIELQAKLLLFLESREIRRVGGVHAIPVQARVVAATNDDLRQRARDRHFRQDLLYR